MGRRDEGFDMYGVFRYGNGCVPSSGETVVYHTQDVCISPMYIYTLTTSPTLYI